MGPGANRDAGPISEKREPTEGTAPMPLARNGQHADSTQPAAPDEESNITRGED